MPLKYTIFKNQRIVVSTGTGQLTAAEIMACINRALNDPEFNPDFDQIVDFREVTSIEASGAETRTLANKPLFSSNSRRAVVAPTPAHFGFARMFAAYHEMSPTPSQLKVFSDLSSALRWLGIDDNSELARGLSGSSAPRSQEIPLPEDAHSDNADGAKM